MMEFDENSMFGTSLAGAALVALLIIAGVGLTIGLGLLLRLMLA